MDNAYDLRGFKRAQVVKTYVNGTLGVFVPACMRASNHKPDANEDKNTKSVANASSIFHDDSPFKASSTECKDNNFILAYPTNFTNESAKNKKTSGARRIPKVGTWLYVFFEDEDPGKCRWTLMCPNMVSTTLPSDTLSDEFSGSLNDDDIHKVDQLGLYEDGTVVAYDEGSKTMLINHTSGHSFKITPNGIFLKTKNGQYANIDDSKNTFDIFGNSAVTVKDKNGNSYVSNSSGIAIKDKNGNSITMNSGGIKIKGITVKIN